MQHGAFFGGGVFFSVHLQPAAMWRVAVMLCGNLCRVSLCVAVLRASEVRRFDARRSAFEGALSYETAL